MLFNLHSPVCKREEYINVSFCFAHTYTNTVKRILHIFYMTDKFISMLVFTE